jgi:glycosyltransferase involved in cell wall biosynthesis
MRILYISPNSPALPKTGSEQRSSLILKAMSKLATVDLAVVAWEEIPKNELDILKNSCGHVIVFNPYEKRSIVKRVFERIRSYLYLAIGDYYTPINRTLEKAIIKITKETKYDLIVVRYLTTARHVNIFQSSNIVVDIDDLPSESYRTNTVLASRTWVMRQFCIYKWNCIKRGTDRNVAKCRHVWVANQQHAIWRNSSHLPNIPFFLSQSNMPDYKAIPSSVNKDEKTVLFVGLMCYQPNVDAMDFYVETVWPRIIAVYPNATMRIVGKDPLPEKQKRWASFTNVTVLGFVENIQAEYAQANVIVAPIFSGSGTNIKVIEAMAYGKPCIISPFAGKGFEHFLKDGQNIVIAKTTEDFAKYTIALLGDSTHAIGIGQAAAEAIHNNFSFNKFCSIVASDMQKALNPTSL